MPKPKTPTIQVGDLWEGITTGTLYEVEKFNTRNVWFSVVSTGGRHSTSVSIFRRGFRKVRTPEPTGVEPLGTPDSTVPAEIAAQPETPAPEPQRPATIADIARALGLKTQAGVHAFEIAVENVQLLDRKQQDYGPGNIAVFGELGVLVRANDKIERLKNLHKTGRLNDPQNESTTDSWLDLSNYGIIAQLIRKGLWN